MRLSGVLGRDVLGPTATGRPSGRITVSLADPHPRVTGLLIRGRGGLARASWSSVASLGPAQVRLREPPEPDGLGAAAELRLGRDVLDAQIVDVAGRRVRRVSDVELVGRGRRLHALAVDTSVGSVLRRLGFRRLSDRSSPAQVDWRDVHLTSATGHALQLASPAAAIHRLAPRELAAVAAQLPAAQGHELLERAGAERAVMPRRRRRFPHRRGRRARA